MALNIDHEFSLHFWKSDGSSVGQVQVPVDFEPARQRARFESVRKGLPAPTAGRAESVVPQFNPRLGEPFMSGFQLRYEADGGSLISCDFPNAYFRPIAVRISQTLIDGGRLQSGESFLYMPAAHRKLAPRPRRPAGPAVRGMTVEECDPPLTIRERSIRALLASSIASGPPSQGDPPVFIPRRVLFEIAASAEAAGAVETGGVLLGHIHRDAEANEAFVVVTAQIPATQAAGELTKLTFTPETWAAVHAAVEARGSDEILVGWHHSHPVDHWASAKEAGEEEGVGMGPAALRGDHFSEQDRHLHRTIFPSAFCVGLVAYLIGGTARNFSLFGWRMGLLEHRGFQILCDDDAPVDRMAHAPGKADD